MGTPPRAGSWGWLARPVAWPLAAPALGLASLLVPAADRPLALNVIILLALCGTVAALLVRARRFPDEAVGWRWYAAGFALFALMYAGVVVGALTGREPPPRFTLLLIPAATLGQVVGLLRFPTPPARPGTRLRSAMDAITFALALIALQWLGGVADLWMDATQPLVDRVLFVTPYAALATTMGVIVYLANAHPERYLGVLGWLLAAEIFGSANNVSALTLSAAGDYWPGHPVDLLATLSLGCTAAAALWPHAIDHRVEPPRLVRLPSYLPYLPVAAVLALLLERHASGRLAPAQGVLWLVYPLLVVVLVRQVLTLGDLRRLSVTLEARVAARTRDLTAASAELQSAHRLESLGRLAGGVAHDFDNLLTGIGGQAYLLGRGRPEADPISGLAGGIAQAVERGAGLTRQILTFARRQPGEPRVFAPAELVRGLEPLLGRLVDDGTTLVVGADGADAGAACVCMDAGQLEQVVVNLVVNARDALRRAGGRIALAVGTRAVDAATAAQHQVTAGAFVTISVEDSGEGMTAATRARIFEPFFTTKAAGHGTGLGLATSHGIVRGAGGFFTVTSEPGRGSCFVVHVPITTARPEATSVAPPPPASRRGRILLVDGSPMVRTTLADALRAGGLEVDTVAGVDEAAALLRAHAGAIDVVVADTPVPDTRVRTILTAGFHEAPAGTLGDHVALLGKPFLPDDLLRRIDRALAAAP